MGEENKIAPISPPPSVVLPNVPERKNQESSPEQASQSSVTSPEKEQKIGTEQVVETKPPGEGSQLPPPVSFNSNVGSSVPTSPAPQVNLEGINQGPANVESGFLNTRETGFEDSSIKSSDLDFFSADVRTYRIGIIHVPDVQPCVVAPVHYKENYFICHTTDESNPKECCDVLGPARPRVGCIVIVYGTDKSGQLRDPFSFELKAWLFGADKYEMMKIANQTFPLKDNDLMATCTEKNYQKMNIQPARGSIWQNAGEEFKTWCITEARKMMKRLPQVLGRKLNRTEMLDKVGLNVAPPSTSHPPVDFNQAVQGS